jgi:hypothetical protein
MSDFLGLRSQWLRSLTQLSRIGAFVIVKMGAFEKSLFVIGARASERTGDDG